MIAPASDHSMQQTQIQSSTPVRAALPDGVVRSIDRGNGSVVIKHGPLASLKMPPMTMAFVAKDETLLVNVEEGDNVRFTPAQGRDGTLIVSTLVVVKK